MPKQDIQERKNREIKFRAWREGKMVYGTDDLYSLVNALKLMEMPSQMIWMQYTGLLDKNGKEIYEGDIVRHSNSTGGFIQGDFVVEMREGRWFPLVTVSSGTLNSYIPESFEIIGNIYENSDLLN